MKVKCVTIQRGLLELQALSKELKCSSTRLSESDAGVRKVCGMTDESLCKVQRTMTAEEACHVPRRSETNGRSDDTVNLQL